MPDLADYLLIDGSRAMTGHLNLASYRIKHDDGQIIFSGLYVHLKNLPGSDWLNLYSKGVFFTGSMRAVAADTNWRTNNAAAALVRFQAYDTTYRDVAQMSNANWIFPSRTLPSSPVTGSIAWDSATSKLRVYDGAAWQDLF